MLESAAGLGGKDRTLAASTVLHQAGHEALAACAAGIVETAGAMADRFRRGGTLFAFGTGLAGSDAEHVAVEFVHPVIVGKPALPALALVAEAVQQDNPEWTFAAPLLALAAPGDIALGITSVPWSAAASAPVRRGLEMAAGRGVLTVALGTVAASLDPGWDDLAGVQHRIDVRAGDACLAKELQVTTYHLLWELTHACLEQDVCWETVG